MYDDFSYPASILKGSGYCASVSNDAAHYVRCIISRPFFLNLFFYLFDSIGLPAVIKSFLLDKNETCVTDFWNCAVVHAACAAVMSPDRLKRAVKKL